MFSVFTVKVTSVCAAPQVTAKSSVSPLTELSESIATLIVPSFEVIASPVWSPEALYNTSPAPLVTTKSS